MTTSQTGARRPPKTCSKKETPVSTPTPPTRPYPNKRHGSLPKSTLSLTSLPVSSIGSSVQVRALTHGLPITVNPPFVYGDPIPELLGPKNYQALSSNMLVYQLLLGPPGRPLPPQIPPFWVSIHDVARAHVLALRVPKLASGASADVREKRFIVAGPGHLLWSDAVRLLAKERPALKERLPSLEDVPPLPGPVATLDTKRAAEMLGMKEYRDMNETLLETVDALLRVEKAWNAAS